MSDAGTIADASTGDAGTLCSNVEVDTRSDPENCGACGNICAGATLVLASSQLNGISRMAIDGTSVYWTSSDDVMKVPLTGGTPTTLASGQMNSASGIAVDATSVYFTNYNPCTPQLSIPAGGPPVFSVGCETEVQGVVKKMPLGGGTPIVLASKQRGPMDVAVDATNVYWVNTDGGTVMSVPLGGGTPLTLASGQTQPMHIALDATHVYWTNTDGTVAKVPLDGGTTTTIAKLSGPSFDIAVDGTRVYLTNGNAGTVLSVPLAGGTTTTLATGQSYPNGVAVDGTTVYFTTSDGTVDAVPSKGGTITTLASDQNSFAPAIAADETSVYWLEGSAVRSLGGKTSLGAARCEQGTCTCPGGRLNCFGVCADTSADDGNCGSCGANCSPGTTCHCGSCN